MSVSIIIPVHNRFEYLKKCIHFINVWNFEDNMDIILSDDNSDENFEEVVSEIKKDCKIPIKSNIYRYSDRPHVFHKSKALNKGCSLSDKKYLLILDSDIILSKGYIRRCIKVSERYEKDCAIGGRKFLMKLKPEDIKNDIDSEELRKKENIIEVELENLFVKDELYDITKHYWSNLYGGAIFLKRDTFNKIGGYDEDYIGFAYEDCYLGLQLRRNKIKILLDYNAEIYHMHHDKHNLSVPHNFVKHYGKNPSDLTIENRKKYFSSFTESEKRMCRS